MKYRPTQLGVYLEIIMYKEKMTQAELAKRIGCHQSTISRIVQGNYSACPRFVAMACKNCPTYFDKKYVQNLAYHSYKKISVNPKVLNEKDLEYIIGRLVEYS